MLLLCSLRSDPLNQAVSDCQHAKFSDGNLKIKNKAEEEQKCLCQFNEFTFEAKPTQSEISENITK